MNYVDTLVSTINPRSQERSDPNPCSMKLNDIENIEEDYISLLNTVQKHDCVRGGYCDKGDGSCIFHFPFKERDKSRLTFDVTRSGNVVASIEHARNDQYLNRHNRTILQNWRANMDVSVILDYNASVKYLTKYVSKSEKAGKSMSSIVHDVLRCTNPTTSGLSVWRSLMIKSVRSRDVGASEVCRLLSGNS